MVKNEQKSRFYKKKYLLIAELSLKSKNTKVSWRKDQIYEEAFTPIKISDIKHLLQANYWSHIDINKFI